ncbi:hypothetical protein LTR37_009424 [Vermiconidia calcicola]|uniref:Uncharacterized protein n=1 Tax=Vermiconidia calcicola TaxID=1690605 RepID=A0ACC3N8D9_9PEZI|nr:hypothetical protein LTR37_009424 [Vermiconidia calcicola]
MEAPSTQSSTFTNIAANDQARLHAGHVYNTYYYYTPSASPRPPDDKSGGTRSDEELLNSVAGSLVKQHALSRESLNSYQHLLPPRRCTHFVQRESSATAIREFFGSEEKSKRFVLWGTGGVGKTQIALDYAHSRIEASNVFWIRSDQLASFSRDYAQVLQLLGPNNNMLDQKVNDMEMLTHAYQALRNCGPVLLILDNADLLDDFLGRSTNSIDLTPFLPENADILITTRDPRFLGAVVPASNGIKVPAMEETEATELLKSSVPPHLATAADGNAVSELLDDLGNLPLAVAQAAANISELQISLSVYTKSYQNRRDRALLMQEPVQGPTRVGTFTKPQSILITWELSFEYLETNYPDSAYCLNAMSLFHWRYIPARFMLRLPRFSKMSTIGFQNVIKRLLHLSLIDDVVDVENLTEYSLHPLVHERIFEKLQQNDVALADLLDAAVNTIAAIFPFLEMEVKRSRVCTQYAIARYLIPHALHQIDVLADLDHDSKGAASLMQVVSRYFQVGNFTTMAVSISDRALDMAGKVWSSEEPPHIYAHKLHAQCMLSNADYEGAKQQSLLCLDLLESQAIQYALGKDKLLAEKLDVIGTLAESVNGLKDFAEYSAISQRRIDLSIEAGLNQRDTRVLRHNLAHSLASIGELDDAERINEELLLEVGQDIEWKAIHQNFYTVMQNLKAKITRMRHPVEVAHRQRLEIFREVFKYTIGNEGPTNLDTWKAVNNLLAELVLQESGQLLPEATDAATQMLMVTLASDIIIQGQFLETFQNFVAIVYSIPDYADAVNVQQLKHLTRKLEKLRALVQVLIEAQDLSLVDVVKPTPHGVNTYAVVFQREGRFAQAELGHRHALELLSSRQYAPDGDLEAVIHYNIMLAISWQPGRLDEAFQYREQHRQMIAKSEATYGDFGTRLSRFKTECELYEDASARLERGWTIEDSG